MRTEGVDMDQPGEGPEPAPPADPAVPDDPSRPTTRTGTGGTGGPPLPPVRRTPSMRPALVVLAIAAGLILVFGVLAAVSNQGPDTVSTSTAPTKVQGSPLRAVAAAKALKPIEHPGTPPDNIIDALTLPEGAAVVSVKDNNTSATQYDEQMQFSVPGATEAAIVKFYKIELAAKGWSVGSVGAATDLPGGVQVLAQKGGDDGWYWEAGAVVSPTTFSSHSGSGSGQEATKFTLRLFEEPDDD